MILFRKMRHFRVGEVTKGICMREITRHRSPEMLAIQLVDYSAILRRILNLFAHSRWK